MASKKPFRLEDIWRIKTRLEIEGSRKDVVGKKEKVFVSKFTGYSTWFILRGFLVDGGNKTFNTVHVNNCHFFKELHAVIDRESVDFLEPQLLVSEKASHLHLMNACRRFLNKQYVGNTTAHALII